MEWQHIDTIPDNLKSGRPVFMLPIGGDDPVVAEWRNGEWVPVSDGARVIEYMSDFGTDYARISPEYWCEVPSTRHLPAESNN